MRWLILTAVALAVIIICIVLSGCAQGFQRPETQLLDVVPEKTQIIAHTLSQTPKQFNTLVLVLVGGLVFWGITRSHWGWVIPGAAIIGMATVVAFARYSGLISLITIFLALTVLIYKAWEYQKERNSK